MQYLLYTFSGVWLFLSHTQFWEVGVCSLKLNKAKNSLVSESYSCRNGLITPFLFLVVVF